MHNSIVNHELTMFVVNHVVVHIALAIAEFDSHQLASHPTNLPIDPSPWEQREQTRQPVAETHSTAPVCVSIRWDSSTDSSDRHHGMGQHGATTTTTIPTNINSNSNERKKERERKAVSKDVVRCVCGK